MYPFWECGAYIESIYGHPLCDEWWDEDSFTTTEEKKRNPEQYNKVVELWTRATD